MRINNATNLLHQRTWVRCFLLIWLAGFNIDFHFEHFFLSLEPLFWSFDLFRVWVCIVFRYLTKTTQNLDAYSMAVSISRPLKPLSNTLALLSSFLTKSVIEGFLLVLPATEVPPIGWQGGFVRDCGGQSHERVFCPKPGLINFRPSPYIATIATSQTTFHRGYSVNISPFPAQEKGRVMVTIFGLKPILPLL